MDNDLKIFMKNSQKTQTEMQFFSKLTDNFQ